MVTRLTWGELEYYRVLGYRSGRIYRVGRMERAYLRACSMLARVKGALVSSKVVRILLGILERIMPPRQLALRKGWERVRELMARLKHSGVFGWAPQIKEWLKNHVFIEYLGFMTLNEPPRLIL